MLKPCFVCGTEFDSHKGAKFCSNECRKQRNKEHSLKQASKMREKYLALDNKMAPENYTCPKCQQTKCITEFNKDKYSKTGYSYQCKDCRNKKKNEYRKTESAKIKRRKRENSLRKYDKVYALRKSVSVFVHKTRFLNGSSKDSKSVFNYLPYTPQDLKEHLEEQFEDWMSWENYGKASKTKRTWNIDHIIPQSRLPFDSMEHPNFLKCWGLENLRPLCAIENIKKHNKIEDLDD